MSKRRLRIEIALWLAAAQLLAAHHALAASTAPPVWEVTDAAVSSMAPAQEIHLRGPDGSALHTFTGADLRAFRNVYTRISATTGFTGAHLLIKEDPSLNAFAAHTNSGVPIVVFTSGMMEVVHGDPDEIAAIMGHEFGHQVLHHRGYAGTTEAINLATQLLDAVIAKNGTNQNVKKAATAVGNMAVTGVLRSFDRDQEREADEFGVKNMIQAGFNPDGAARLWEMPQMQGGGWLNTHPSSTERLENVRTFAVKYASLAPAPGTIKGPDTGAPSPPKNPFAEAMGKLQAELEAHCKKDGLALFYKKTACHPKDISFDQLADTSKATADEKPQIQQVQNEINDIEGRMAQVLRQYAGDKGNRAAAVTEKIHDLSEQNMMDLYTQKETWGDYNRKRKELANQARDEINAIKAEKPAADSSHSATNGHG